jgi:hypothetical protein
MFFVVSLLPSLAIADTNVALGKNVTLNGTFFTGSSLGGWTGDVISPASSIVNGVFVAEETQWNTAGVWWNGNLYPNNNIVINLGGTYTIDSFTVQADDNDTYRVLDLGSGGTWYDAYDVPMISSWGLVTRNSGTLATPIVTSELMIEETSGDGYYSVSQVVAMGTGTAAVPEPATMLLLGLGLGLVGLAGARRKIKK